MIRAFLHFLFLFLFFSSSSFHILCFLTDLTGFFSPRLFSFFPHGNPNSFPSGWFSQPRAAEWSCPHITQPNRITASAWRPAWVSSSEGSLTEGCRYLSLLPGRPALFHRVLLLEICQPPSGFLSGSVICGAPDGRFVDMITWLDYRMDDTVAASQSAAHREVMTPLFNLSSGARRSAPALG